MNYEGRHNEQAVQWEREVNTLSKDKLVMLKTDVIIKCAFIEMHLKSQKHLITNLFTHSSTMFKNRPKCLVLPNNLKKRLDGVISKDFALIRKLHLQFLTSLKLIFPFLIDFSARISTQVSGINNRITSIQICKWMRAADFFS